MYPTQLFDIVSELPHILTVQQQIGYGSLGAASSAVPLLHGESGTQQTVSFAQRLVDSAVKDPFVRRFAVQIVANTQNFDDLAKVQAIYDWVKANVRYVNHPVGPFGEKQLLHTVRDLLAIGAGDCANINLVLFPALLGAIGYRTRIVTVAVDPQDPEQFSHVYCEVDVNGSWIPMDAARPGAQFGLAPQFYFRKKIWPMSDANPSIFSGMSRLSGMGDAAEDVAMAQLIAASGGAAAQVISAANQNPYSFQSFATSNSPGAVSPQLGYGATATLSANSMLPILGLGLLLVFLMSKK